MQQRPCFKAGCTLGLQFWIRQSNLLSYLELPIQFIHGWRAKCTKAGGRERQPSGHSSDDPDARVEDILADVRKRLGHSANLPCVEAAEVIEARGGCEGPVLRLPQHLSVY